MEEKSLEGGGSCTLRSNKDPGALPSGRQSTYCGSAEAGQRVGALRPRSYTLFAMIPDKMVSSVDSCQERCKGHLD